MAEDALQFQRQSFPFLATGMDLSTARDSATRLREGVWSLLQNAATQEPGVVTPRSGTVELFTISGGPVHSIRRLSDIDDSDKRILGVGTNLYVQNAITNSAPSAVDSLYSGNPLTFVPWNVTRPDSSAPWMYVGDSQRMRKVSTNGDVHHVGIPGPTTPPDAREASLTPGVAAARQYINQLHTFSQQEKWYNVRWNVATSDIYPDSPDNTNPGYSAYKTVKAGEPNARVNEVPSITIWDANGGALSPITDREGGWGNILFGASPNHQNPKDIGPGTILYAERNSPGAYLRDRDTSVKYAMVVQDVYSGSLGPNKSADDASTSRVTSASALGFGIFSVTVDVWDDTFKPNAIVVFKQLSIASVHYCRILSIFDDPNDMSKKSLHIYSTDGTAPAASPVTAIYTVPSIRLYANGWTLYNGAITNTPPASGTIWASASSLTATCQLSGVTRLMTASSAATEPVQISGTTVVYEGGKNASRVSSIGEWKPPAVSDDDYVHLSVYFDAQAVKNVQEIRVLLRLGNQDSSKWPQGYYKFNRDTVMLTIQSSELAQVVGGSQTTGQSGGDGTTTPKNNTGIPIGSLNGNEYRPPRAGLGFTASGKIQVPDETVPPEPSSTNETSTGDRNPNKKPINGGLPAVSQWKEIFWKVSEMEWLGEQRDWTLKDITGIAFEIVHTGTCAVKFGSFWIGGGYGPDVAEADQPYYYRYRFRATKTGARTAYSTPTYNPVRVARQAIAVTIPPVTSMRPDIVVGSMNTPYWDNTSLAYIDRVDIERWGGSISDWRYIDSVPIAGLNSNTIYVDKTDDFTASATADVSGEQIMQPFPQIRPKVSGLCSTYGNYVVATSGTFDPRWIPQQTIRIAGRPYQIHRVMSSTKMLLYASADAQTGIPWEMLEPLVEGNPLPHIARFNEHLLGWGDDEAPGRLWYTNRNDPEAARGTNFVEITDENDPLMNGAEWNGRFYLFSHHRTFELVPSQDEQGLPSVTPRELPNGRGLQSEWALTTGDMIYYVSDDGIYAFGGGDSKCISDKLLPLFAPDNIPSVTNEFPLPLPFTKSTIPAVGMTPISATIPADKSYAKRLRLSYGQNQLYFDYLGHGNSTSTGLGGSFVFNLRTGGWWFNKYTDTRVHTHYWDETDDGSRALLVAGEPTESVYGASALLLRYDPAARGDRTSLLNGIGRPFDFDIDSLDFDAGDPRPDKLWGDWTLEAETGTEALKTDTLNCYLYNRAGSIATSDTFSVTGRARKIYDINLGDGAYSRTMRFRLHATVGDSDISSKIRLYRYEFSWRPRPEDTRLRSTDWSGEGHNGIMYIRGIIVDAEGAVKTLELVGDGDAGPSVLYTITNANHFTRKRREYGIYPPISTPLFRLRPDDTTPNDWKLFGYQLVYDKEPNVTTTPTPWLPGNDLRAKFVQGMRLRANTRNVPVTIKIESDGAVVERTISINHHQMLIRPYSWEPFITHEVRLVPQGGASIDQVELVYEPEPELTQHWESQDIAFGPGWGHLREVWFSVMLSTPGQTIQLELQRDGATTGEIYLPALPISYGTRTKARFFIQPLKGLLHRFALTSAQPFRLYVKDCEVLYKPFGSGGEYQRIKPFGDEHARVGATI